LKNLKKPLKIRKQVKTYKMNSQISNDIHVTKDGETKNHQAFAMELSRLKKAKKTCEENKGCDEFNRLGGENKLKEVGYLW